MIKMIMRRRIEHPKAETAVRDLLVYLYNETNLQQTAASDILLLLLSGTDNPIGKV